MFSFYFYKLIIDSLQPTMLQLVPPLVSYLSVRSDLKLDSFRRLHTIIIGAAPLGPAVANMLIERLGKPDLLMQEGIRN